MSKILSRLVAVALGSTSLCALSTAANAKVVLLGDDPAGWEFSTDGSLNAFIVQSNPESMPTATGGATREAAAGAIEGGTTTDSSATRVRSGLLPSVFGFNVKSPDIEGMRMGARLGLYPGLNANTGGGKNATGLGQVDVREAFFTVDGSWGQVQAGKSLSQFLGANILQDMTLFGVGATGGNSGTVGNTALGAIGHGYVYPAFNANVRYTTPVMNGIKGSVGVYDPSYVQGSRPEGGTAPRAAITELPRFEGDVSWAGKVGDNPVTLFANAMWQEAKFASGQAAASGGSLVGQSVTAWGTGAGGKVSFGGLSLGATGYVGEALGTGLMLDSNSLDRDGKEHDNYGGYVQALYSFGQGTSVGVQYGASFQDETSAEKAARTANTAVALDHSTLLAVQGFHDINKYFRLVAEYDRTVDTWHDGADRADNTFAVGAFVFW